MHILTSYIGAVGSYAIKLAKRSNIHPIIAVAGKAQDHVEKLIDRSKGDAIVDYRKGDEAVVSGIKEALMKAGHNEVRYAFDAVSEHNSFQNISQVLGKGGKITLVLPGSNYLAIPDYIEKTTTMVGAVHAMMLEPGSAEAEGGKDFGYVFFRLFGRGLQDGWLTTHPYEVIPGGLNGVEQGLANLKAGKASAVKYIFKISDA